MLRFLPCPEWSLCLFMMTQRKIKTSPIHLTDILLFVWRWVSHTFFLYDGYSKRSICVFDSVTFRRLAIQNLTTLTKRVQSALLRTSTTLSHSTVGWSVHPPAPMEWPAPWERWTPTLSLPTPNPSPWIPFTSVLAPGSSVQPGPSTLKEMQVWSCQVPLLSSARKRVRKYWLYNYTNFEGDHF